MYKEPRILVPGSLDGFYLPLEIRSLGMTLGVVLLFDLAATATFTGLREAYALLEGGALRRQRPSGKAEGHTKRQQKRHDQQCNALRHLLTPFAWSEKGRKTTDHPHPLTARCSEDEPMTTWLHERLLRRS